MRKKFSAKICLHMLRDNKSGYVCVRSYYKLGVVAHAYNPSTWEAETGGSRFATSLSYLVRPSATS